MGTQLPLPKGAQPPNLRPMSVVAKQLDGSRCHLLGRSVSAQATLCYTGTQLLSKKGTQQPPLFGPCLLWRNGSMDQDATWYGGGPWPLGSGHTVLDGTQLAPIQRGTDPQFSAHICCSQTVGWIKMPLGMEDGLGPLAQATLCWMGPSSPPYKGAQTPNFRPISVVAKRLDGSRCHLVRR